MLLDLLSIFRQVATEDLHDSRYQYDLLQWGRLFHCRTGRAREAGLFVLLCLESGIRYPCGFAVRVGLVMYLHVFRPTDTEESGQTRRVPGRRA